MPTESPAVRRSQRTGRTGGPPPQLLRGIEIFRQFFACAGIVPRASISSLTEISYDLLVFAAGIAVAVFRQSAV